MNLFGNNFYKLLQVNIIYRVVRYFNKHYKLNLLAIN